jgi:DNA-binding transcriptional LysR family regulator
MWDQVELRELRVFLVLSEELHFGRTAERLGLTQSRVSQILRGLERKLGGQLFSRTSRRVALSPFGEQFRADLEPPYAQLSSVLQRTRAGARSLDGHLRLGLLAANSGGPHLTEIIDAFERSHPQTEVVVSEVFFTDPLGALRRGEVDVLATRLPLQQPDLVIGPVLAREPVVLAVASDHPLADRGQISIEDVADYQVAPITDTPKELIDTLIPRSTPSGRAIRRQAKRPKTPHEVTALIARGRIVHLTVPSFATYYGQPGITYLPVTDMRPSKSGLVWRRAASNPRLREFIRITREVLATHRQPSGAR